MARNFSNRVKPSHIMRLAITSAMKTATLLVSLIVSVVMCAQQPSGSRARVEVPGVTGVLEIDVGATPWHLDFLPEDKWTMLQARQRPDHIAISALLRQVEFA